MRRVSRLANPKNDTQKLIHRKVFVGNLPWSVRTDQLAQILGELGVKYRSVKVVEERDTGRSRGFAFVECSNEVESKQAMELISGHTIEGRVLVADVAEPKVKRGNDKPKGSQEAEAPQERTQGFGSGWGRW
jgi:RNA recognition motif-containing protein